MRLFLSIGALCFISGLASSDGSENLIDRFDDQIPFDIDIRSFSPVEDEVDLHEEPAEKKSSQKKLYSNIKTTMAGRNLMPDQVEIDSYPNYITENAESSRKKRSADGGLEEIRPHSVPNSQLLSNYDYDLSQENELVSHNVPRRALSNTDDLDSGSSLKSWRFVPPKNFETMNDLDILKASFNGKNDEVVLKSNGRSLSSDLKARRSIPNSEVIRDDDMDYSAGSSGLREHSAPTRQIRDEIRSKCPCQMDNDKEDTDTHIRIPKHITGSSRVETFNDYVDDIPRSHSIPNSEPFSMEDDYYDDEIPETDPSHFRQRRDIDNYMNDEHFLDVLVDSESDTTKKSDGNKKIVDPSFKKPVINNIPTSFVKKPIRRPVVPNNVQPVIPKSRSPKESNGNSDFGMNDPHFLDVLINGNEKEDNSLSKPKTKDPDFSILNSSSMKKNNHQGTNQYDQNFDVSVDSRYNQFRNKFTGNNNGGFSDITFPDYNKSRYPIRRNMRNPNSDVNNFNNGLSRPQQNQGRLPPSKKSGADDLPSDENFLSVLIDPTKDNVSEGHDGSQDYNQFEHNGKYGNRQRGYGGHQRTHGLGRIPPNLHASGDHGEIGVEYIQGIPIPHGFRSQSNTRRHYEDNNRRRYPSGNFNSQGNQNGEDNYKIKFMDEQNNVNMNSVFKGLNSFVDRDRQRYNNQNGYRQSINNGYIHPDLLTRLKMRYGDDINDFFSNLQNSADFRSESQDSSRREYIPENKNTYLRNSNGPWTEVGKENISKIQNVKLFARNMDSSNLQSPVDTETGNPDTSEKENVPENKNMVNGKQSEEGKKKNGAHSSIKLGPLSLQFGLGN